VCPSPGSDSNARAPLQNASDAVMTATAVRLMLELNWRRPRADRAIKQAIVASAQGHAGKEGGGG
jgi:hypothetical protein